MPYWDDHRVCRACRGYSCSPTSTCEVCGSWSEDTWKKFSKCLQRASKSKVATIAQAPEKGPGQPSATLGSLSEGVDRGGRGYGGGGCGIRGGGCGIGGGGCG